MGLSEVFRALKPGGRLAIAMWGPRYSEVRLNNVARHRAGLPPFPPAAPAAAVKRVGRAGFDGVKRIDEKFDVVHDSVEAYLEFRSAFGRPPTLTEVEWGRLYKEMEGVHRERSGDGPVLLDWTVSYILGHRPAHTNL